MGFSETIKNFLGVVSKKDFEQLNETLAVQNEMLKIAANMPNTKPSAVSVESQPVDNAEGLIKKRVPVKELQLLYINNQFIFRGVNVRADELVSRGYKLIGDDERGIELCQELIDNSGGDNLFWQWSVNTDVSGQGYLEEVTNESETRIAYLKHVNAINFGFLTEEKDETKIILGPDGTPKAYMLKYKDKDGKEQRKEIKKNKIVHLKFNTFGDEFYGISSIQPVYNTAIRLMNMEHAAAEAAVKTANPTWVVETETKSPQDLARWASILGRISAKEVVFLPMGVKPSLMSPGNQNFSAYSDYFLNAVVADLGVPKSILTGSSDAGGGNRATIQTLSRHFYSIIRTNQRYMEASINKIFEHYGKMAGFTAPKLQFNDVAEDADRNGQRAMELYTGGLVTLKEARRMIGLDTPKNIEEELDKQNTQEAGNIDPMKEDKKNDMKAFHPAAPGSPEGSQKGEKKEKKLDPNVPSVK